MKTVMRWMVLAVAVWVAAAIVPGIGYDDTPSLLIAALVLSILNTFVKPLLQLLSLPFIVLTFGLFLIVLNAILLLLTAWLVAGFHVASFWSAAGGSLVVSVVSMALGIRNPGSTVVTGGRIEMINRGLRGPPPGKGDVIDV